MAHAYLEKLSTALHGFLTPGQIPELAGHVLTELSSAATSFVGIESRSAADEGERPRKKRKGLQTGSTPPLADADDLACRVVVLSGIAAVVLGSSPLQTLQDGVRAEVLQTVQSSYTSLQAVITKGLKRLRREDRADSWAWEAVTVAVLRLQYRLSSAPQLHIPIEQDEKALTRMAELLKVETLLPELRVTMVRCAFTRAYPVLTHPPKCQTLCAAVSRGWQGSASLFDSLVGIIEHHREDVRWTGHLHAMPADALPVACFHLLMERWLALFE